MSSWVPGADGSGFGIENLPYGVVRRRGSGGSPRCAVRIGDWALDLGAVAGRGLLNVPGLPDAVFEQATLNAYLELGRGVWDRVRSRLVELLRSGGDPALGDNAELRARTLIALSDCDTLLPVSIGDYVDFYSSLEHATNAGAILRPGAAALAPNWRRLPVGYHGRAGTVVVSGTPVSRPRGQRARAAGAEGSTFVPERCLDCELELGFFTGSGPALGTPIAAGEAWRHIFGFVLVGDWSAREIQRYESVPLGPFLGKSFATSVSAWIVPVQALEPLLVEGVAQAPAPLDHLQVAEPRSLDLELELELAAAAEPSAVSVGRVNSRGLYWSPAQQLAHATSNGASVRSGDLFASGTVSGAHPGTYGCLLEATWGGRDPIALPSGARQAFLGDGDTITLRGAGVLPDGTRIELGEVCGTVLAA